MGTEVKARGLRAYLLRRLGRTGEALRQAQENLELDPFDFVSGNERIRLEGDQRGEKRQALNEEAWERAEELLQRAFVYPENLGEGKLEGTKDNHLYYHLGLALEGQGRDAEAKECFESATLGTDEPAGAMYYNDQPADMILYQGLAYLKLGKAREARARFCRLIDYGERHLEDPVKIQYFAVSLPEFLIFDEDYALRNRTPLLLPDGSWKSGTGRCRKAAGYLKEAVQTEPSHMMCRVYQRRYFQS